MVAKLMQCSYLTFENLYTSHWSHWSIMEQPKETMLNTETEGFNT